MSNEVDLIFIFDEHVDAQKFLTDLQKSALEKGFELEFDVNEAIAFVNTTSDACRELYGWDLQQVERNVPRRAPNPSINRGTYLAWVGETPVLPQWQDIVENVAIDGRISMF